VEVNSVKKCTLLLCLLAAPGFAQWFSIGVKGGVPLTNAFDTVTQGDVSYLTDTKRYTVGPVVDLRFPLGLGVEFNALYKRLTYEFQEGTTRGSTTANSWEFPLLLKIRAPSEGIRPYLSTGASFRRLNDVKQTLGSIVSGNFSEVTPSELENRFAAGFVIGGGLEFGDRFRVAPEIRYTRWGWENFSIPSGALRTNLNQVDFLLGLHF
jgi:opacity protein-like surface antigen